jgi:hypothetical protein
VFYTQGSFTKGMGFRTEIRPRRGDIQLFIGYEFFRYTTVGSVESTDWLIRHTIRAGLSFPIGNWYVNLTADHYFGNNENSYNLGTYVEYRF